jgi:RNA polymerase sigma-70 factor (ECF subfamily)
LGDCQPDSWGHRVRRDGDEDETWARESPTAHQSGPCRDVRRVAPDRNTTGAYLRQERPDHTLQATSLVNEAYLRLIDINRVEWRNRAHFLALAAQMMRRILVEFARNRQRQKRGGGAVHVSLDDVQELPDSKERDVVALSDALRELATFDARMSQVVELKFFGGLTVEETAEVLNVSPETVMRDWKTAKAWLLREISRRHSTASS